ncbi:peptidase M23 [Deltaproteobacteria bacterium]|nr:peptidase M23 [Deltaproteobacteria bacterium]
MSLLALLLAAGAVLAAPTPIVQPAAADPLVGLTAPEPAFRTESREVRAGELAGKVLREMGAPTAELLAGAGRSLDSVSPGDVFNLDYRAGETRPFRLRLVHDPAMVNELVWDGKRYVARKVPVPYTVEEMAAAVTVTSSLWSAATSVGFSPAQVLDLAKIFEYDVDFNTELVEGARFRLVLDRLTADDGSQSVGDIRAAILDNGGKQYVAIRYRAADGTTGWYAKDGSARRKAFLRSPLEFLQVTSSFSTGRYHPILHKMRAHKGVDLAAPTGTNIRAVADGVITRAGWAGGHGNHVEIKHEGGFSTGYSHLSSIGVKVGERVQQGRSIGRVGSTGQSTGPHLHYEFMVNGVHKDPMKTIVPVAQPLPASEKAAFAAARDALLPRLEGATELTAGAVADAAEDRGPGR